MKSWFNLFISNAGCIFHKISDKVARIIRIKFCIDMHGHVASNERKYWLIREFYHFVCNFFFIVCYTIIKVSI